MQPVLVQPDGLHLTAAFTPARLAAESALQDFADGMLPAALQSLPEPWRGVTLAQLTYHPGSEANGLLAALLALDAEIIAGVGKERRQVPLAGFLGYRRRLSSAKFSPHTLRLPPLNPDGHYMFTEINDDDFLAVRFDRHPRLRIAGHIRIATGGVSAPPQRLTPIEHRLDHRPLDAAVIDTALTAGNAELPVPLPAAALARLAELLGQGDNRP